MTQRPSFLIAVVVSLFASVVMAQYSTSSPYAPLTIPTPNGDSCSVTWYYPNIHLMPNGIDLGLLAQAGAPNSCQVPALDSIFAGQRDLNGFWTLPALGECPRLQGAYTRCSFGAGVNSGPIAHPSVIRLANNNSLSGQRYFMAFSGGNVDSIEGKVYWAYSDDGANWSVYNWNAPENWTPILYPKYERSAAYPRSAITCSPSSGIAQMNLAYENGYVYLFVMYYHPIQPECTDANGGHNGTLCANSGWQAYDRALSPWLLRFTYDPNHPYGFGAGGYQVYVNGAWASESGKLVWPYDVDANSNQLPPDTGNPVLGIYDGVQTAGFQFGAGDLKYGNGKWLHAVSWNGAYVQTATCLDAAACSWSALQSLDDSAIRAVYSNMDEGEGMGLYYGPLRKADGTYTGTHWWIWMPVPTDNKACIDGAGNRNVFAGQSLASAQLCAPDVPCGN